MAGKGEENENAEYGNGSRAHGGNSHKERFPGLLRVCWERVGPDPPLSGEQDECPPTDPMFHVRVSQGRVSAVRETVSYTCIPNSRVAFDPRPQLPNTILYSPSVNVQRI